MFEGKKNMDCFGRFQETLGRPNRALGDLQTRDLFIKEMMAHQMSQASYIDTIPTLSSQTRILGTQWLQGIVDAIVSAGDGLMNLSD